MLEAGAEALVHILTLERIAFIVLGAVIGLVIGILPGMGGAVGMSLALPFVFGMDAYTGMGLLMGMVGVIHTADSFPSVLLGVPGSSGAQATIMDGYPLAQQGQAARALGSAFSASILGGLIGGVALFAIVTVVRPLVLLLGSPQLFMACILGLSMVGVLSRGSAVAGVLSGVFGLFLGVIGMAPAVGEYRFTGEIVYLFDGVPLAVLALGLFAVPEMLDLVVQGKSIAGRAELTGSRLQGVRDTLRNWWLVLRSAVIGLGVGMIPGLGGPVVDWINYGVAQRTCKNTEGFGKGDIRGVIAPESSNNAKECGTLVPSMLFGVPGSSTTAILLGGLILMGIEPGPAMVGRDLPVMLAIIWTLVLGNIIGASLCLGLSGAISRISLIPGKTLVPFLLVIMVVGAYQSTRHWGDIIVFIAIGLLGWVMKKIKMQRAPMLIGFVLSTPAERYLHISMSHYGLAWLRDPVVITIAVLVIGILGYGGFQSKGAREASKEVGDA